MKCQILFSWKKNKKNISKRCLLEFYPGCYWRLVSLLYVYAKNDSIINSKWI